MRIERRDIEKYGMTPGCEGCIQVNRGAPARKHTRDCRERAEAKIQEEDPERYEKNVKRILGQHEERVLEEERENKERVRVL